MSKLAVRALVLSGVIALLGVGLRDRRGSKEFKARQLTGYEENPTSRPSPPARSRPSSPTTARRSSTASSGLEGDVQQAHVHFGKRAVNGGISFFLCSNLGNGPAGRRVLGPTVRYGRG